MSVGTKDSNAELSAVVHVLAVCREGSAYNKVCHSQHGLMHSSTG